MSKKKKKILSPKEQLEHLKSRYGSNLDWVEITLPMTFHEVESYFGPECKEYNHLCGCCNAWQEWHTKAQKVTVLLERNDIIKALNND